MSPTHERWSPPARDPDDDTPRLECGVFGIFDAPEASGITALGLHALQHRGQEACGIASFDGHKFYTERHQGHVGDAFTGARTWPIASNMGRLLETLAPQGLDVAGRLKPAFDRAVGEGSGDRTTTDGYEAREPADTDRPERSR